jgi:hypothetical protein
MATTYQTYSFDFKGLITDEKNFKSSNLERFLGPMQHAEYRDYED